MGLQGLILDFGGSISDLVSVPILESGTLEHLEHLEWLEQLEQLER